MTKKTNGRDDVLTIRVGDGELMYIGRDVHKGTATEGQKAVAVRRTTAAGYGKTVAAGFKRIAANHTWVKNHESKIA